MPLRRSFPRVLCVARSDNALETLNTALKGVPLQLLTAVTRNQAVAVCVAELVAAVVLDGETIRGPELSLAKALKGVRPGVPIILLEERWRLSTDLPERVDAAVPIDAPEELRTIIERLLLKTG